MNELQVRHYMAQVAGEYVDDLTGEVSATGIAEDACQHFDAYDGDGDNIPEDLFDWAYNAARNYESKHQTIDAAELA